MINPKHHLGPSTSGQVKTGEAGQVKAAEGGQVIVEYVLLLVVAVAMATIIVTQVVQRNPDSPGFLIKKWGEIQKTIGDDDPGKK